MGGLTAINKAVKLPKTAHYGRPSAREAWTLLLHFLKAFSTLFNLLKYFNYGPNTKGHSKELKHTNYTQETKHKRSREKSNFHKYGHRPPWILIGELEMTMQIQRTKGRGVRHSGSGGIQHGSSWKMVWKVSSGTPWCGVKGI